MPVGHQPTRRYFSISKEGKVRYKDPDTKQEHLYDFIEGILTKIDLVQDEYEGEVIYKWHFHLEDKEHTQTDVLQVGEASSAARGIIMSLFSVDGPIEHIYVRPYKKKDVKYTNVWFEHNGETVDWDEQLIEALPEVDVIDTGYKKIPNDGERRKFIRGLAARVKKQKLNIRQNEYESNQNRPSGPGHSDPLEKQRVISDEELNTVDWDEEDDLPF